MIFIFVSVFHVVSALWIGSMRHLCLVLVGLHGPAASEPHVAADPRFVQAIMELGPDGSPASSAPLGLLTHGRWGVTAELSFTHYFSQGVDKGGRLG